ncbi:MAG: PD-(D/E)XK nuclease family protein [Eubacterium sp.]|jgi:ATP-dependent helicase/nuclease subunit B|nr:PD-(D/E)XK nuclease family protein [Eubacterium sp.]MCI2196897.1 PD-(D/E)XK nuclease family protein [Eubacterium sp.]
MLNIYYGRDSLDKEKFMYRRIGEQGYGPDRRVLVLVPDQYTLEAERQAAKYLETDVLLGVDIYSVSHLGHTILKETGAARLPFVDKYGRQMLLTRIMSEEGENLEVFRASRDRSSFIEMTNDFISQMKQYGVTPETLETLMKKVQEGSLLQRKMADLLLVYTRYQEEIAGKYTDSEDYVDLYAQQMRRSELIAGSRVWVYGFDSFAPKTLDVLQGIMHAAESVNVVLTKDERCKDEDLFSLTQTVQANLLKRADAERCPIGEIARIPAALPDGISLIREKASPALAYLEKELFAPVIAPYRKNTEHVLLTEAANPHNEAESAAAFILHLLRDCGYRYRDISVVCNDAARAEAAGRVFEEYGLPLFLDSKRSILDAPAAVCILAMLNAVQKRWNTREILRALKSGLSDFSNDEIERLENYVMKYRIRGSMWKKPFQKGELEYGKEGMEKLDALRDRVAQLFMPLEEILKRKQTNEEFIRAFYGFLTETMHLEDRMDRLMLLQEENGLQTAADETAQVWSMIVGLLDQIDALAGDDEFQPDLFIELLTAGLQQVEIGVLPSTADDLVMGTMQRTRTASVRALIVMGANEGVLPEGPKDDGLFGMDELETLADFGQEICKVDSVRVQEEKLAIYRNFSSPSDVLWISWSNADMEGANTRPSELIGTMQELFPEIPVRRDILNEDSDEAEVGGKLSTLRHLTQKLNQAYREGVKIDPIWGDVQRWYQENMPEAAARMEEGLRFQNKPPRLDPKLTNLLFRRKENKDYLALSASRLERFSRCPFSYYVQFGLAPEERRVFEAGGREIGDMYHRCIMDVTAELSRRGIWDSVSEEDCRELVQQSIRQESEMYREGLFFFGGRERYRSSRMQEACIDTVKALVEHVRQGAVQASQFEVRFGPGAEIPPIRIELNDGTIVLIEGQIDRLDILQNDRIKIIDYKSSEHKLDVEEIRAGYSLQLMVYMQAAEEQVRQPAGVFYFHIQEPRIDVKNKPAAGTPSDALKLQVQKEIQSHFKLNGLLLNDPETVREVAGELAPKESSSVVAVKMLKSGELGKSGTLISEEDFQELQNDVADKVTELITEMHEGIIDIHPMKNGDDTACKYCEFKSICRFDPAFRGNQYNVIK